MYKTTPPLPFRDDIKVWNQTAIDSYSINCNCKKCFIYNTFFKYLDEECKMKYYVKYNIEKIGEPATDF